SAMTCKASVVLPELSGPKISTIRPLGRPPMPSAISRPSEPVEIASTSMEVFSPRRMIEPLPKFLSIWLSAACNALSLSIDPPSTTRSGEAAIMLSPYFTLSKATQREERSAICAISVLYLFSFCFHDVKRQNENKATRHQRRDRPWDRPIL